MLIIALYILNYILYRCNYRIR